MFTKVLIVFLDFMSSGQFWWLSSEGCARLATGYQQAYPSWNDVGHFL